MDAATRNGRRDAICAIRYLGRHEGPAPQWRYPASPARDPAQHCTAWHLWLVWAADRAAGRPARSPPQLAPRMRRDLQAVLARPCPAAAQGARRRYLRRLRPRYGDEALAQVTADHAAAGRRPLCRPLLPGGVDGAARLGAGPCRSAGGWRHARAGEHADPVQAMPPGQDGAGGDRASTTQEVAQRLCCGGAGRHCPY